MVGSKKIILYQAFNFPFIYNQVLFSIITLHFHLKGEFDGIHIVIYTDKPEVFLMYQEKIPTSIEILTKQQIQSYKGQRNFIHRVKIYVMQDCFAKYKSDILYLDADTYFRSSPWPVLQKIDRQTFIMNSDDYDLITADPMYRNKDWLAIQTAISDFSYNLGNKATSIPLTTRMWNAGVIGVSLENQGLLEDVLGLTDQIYANKQVFTAEQFAFSYILQTYSQVVSSGDIIMHYWQYFAPFFYKKIYNHHIKIFLKKYKKAPLELQALKAHEITIKHNKLTAPLFTAITKVYFRLRQIVLIKTKQLVGNG